MAIVFYDIDGLRLFINERGSVPPIILCPVSNSPKAFLNGLKN